MDSKVNKDSSGSEASESPPDTSASASSSDANSMTSLSSNPFKKLPQDDNWTKETNNEHRPILAPPRLKAPSDNASSAPSFASSSGGGSSSSIFRPSTLLPSSERINTLGPTRGSIFGGSTTTTTTVFSSCSNNSSSLPSGSKPAFKLKPSMLSGFSSSSGSASAAESSSVGETKGDAPGKEKQSTDKVEESSSSQSESVKTSSSSTTASPSSSSGGKDNVDTSPQVPTLLVTPPPSISRPLQSPTLASNDSKRPSFVPLTSTNDSSSSEEVSKMNGMPPTSTSPLSSRVSGGFIFGQNLQNRVSGIDESSNRSLFSSAGVMANGDAGGGATENLFKEAATGLTPQGAASPEEGGGAWGGKSLMESSLELSEKEASQKRKYEEVEVITGEENESNVLQMMCKLYLFSMGLWQEKGRGLLRLNDMKINGEIHSRLVIRTQGTFTVMLNAKIWADMSIEKTNDKSVRFTASDSDGQLKIFLVMGAPKDIDLLYNSLEYRVAESQSQKPLDENSLSPDLKKFRKSNEPPPNSST